jgi:hypothetical protein
MSPENGEVVILEDAYDAGNPFEGAQLNDGFGFSPPNGARTGPEKLLELWFAPSADECPAPPAASTSSRRLAGLRNVPREAWQVMLDEVRCKVLSIVEGEELDAYLLRWAALA